MATQQKHMQGVSRRGFIKGAAVAGTAMAAAGALGGAKSASAQAPAAVPESWDYEADVVVVGYGGAGAAAAITAHDAGAKVILLEKMPEGKQGGNTRVSGNVTLAPNPEDLDTFKEYLRNADYWEQVPDDVSDAIAEEYVKNEEWLTEIGCKPFAMTAAAEVLVPGGESVRLVLNVTAEGTGLGNEAVWKVVQANVEDREIEVLFAAPAKRLVASDGEVRGVVAEQDGKEIFVKAGRAVVLATGGYEFNDQMQKDYAPAYPLSYLGCPGNTGDGVLMAQALGADLWHMNNVMGAIAGGIKVPESEVPAWSAFGEIALLLGGTPVFNFIFVDKLGRRFMNEMKDSAHGWGWREILYFDRELMTYPMIPWYCIFDETVRTAGPIALTNLTWPAIIDGLVWSEDNTAEIENGVIMKADTIAELAELIKAREANEGRMDADRLVETVARYNEACALGKDLQWNRPAEDLAALSTPPFYAVEMWPSSVNTQGGPRRDGQCRIIHVAGEPIPRLYSAGELGSIWASLYQGAGNVGEAFASGRIAGRNAAAEEPWE